MRATNWRLPLVDGGLEDQPEALLDDILTLEAVANQMKHLREMERKPADGNQS